MAEFVPITTQEQFDAAIGERLKRERETTARRYGDYDELKGRVAEYEKQIGELTRGAEEAAKKYAGYDKTVADLQAKVKGYETASVKTRIAHETGLPYELAARLSGETEDEIRTDAAALSELLGRSRGPAPLRSTEPADLDPKKAALTQMLHKLKGE